MESTQELKILEVKKAERQTALAQWAGSVCQIQPVSLQPMLGDASLRRYFRIFVRGQSYVLMDAPPPQENCYLFASISESLRKMGLQTPEIIHADYKRGFLMITDFSDATYLK